MVPTVAVVWAKRRFVVARECTVVVSVSINIGGVIMIMAVTAPDWAAVLVTIAVVDIVSWVGAAWDARVI